MATAITDLLQQALNSKPLQQISPNTQELDKSAADVTNASKIQQAVIASVLMGYYKLTRTHEGAAMVINGPGEKSWTDILFGDNKEAAIASIAAYGVSSPAAAAAETDYAATETQQLIKQEAASSGELTEDGVITYMKGQRNNILPVLPAALQLGTLLDDDTLDDHTHKMDGPVSGLMHAIEKAFSGTPPADEKS